MMPARVCEVQHDGYDPLYVSFPCLTLSSSRTLLPHRALFSAHVQVGLMLKGLTVDNIVFGGPAYNSQVCGANV